MRAGLARVHRRAAARQRLHRENDFAPRLTLTEEVERGWRLLERKGCANDGRHGSGLDHAGQRVLRLDEQSRLDGEEGTPCGTDHVDVAKQHAVDLDTGDPALGETDHDEPALGGKAANALVEPLSTHRIEYRVHAEAVVLRTERGHPV